MFLVVLSAGFVGWIHSLAPAHWLPIVLIAKARKWSSSEALAGVLFASLGHILTSSILGLLCAFLGTSFLDQVEHAESYSGWILIGFGSLYAAYSYYRHRQCVGHTHHGPRIEKRQLPYMMLFVAGLSPCLAVLPPFVAAVPYGEVALGLSVLAFSGGVILALASATFLTIRGLMKLDHPWIEHHGDTLAGLSIVVIGLFLVLSVGHSH